jgi:hypothetical protein
LQEVQADHRWASYFTQVYGQLPTKYPVCVYDNQFINKDLYNSVGLNETRLPVRNISNLEEGDLFNVNGEYGIFHEKWVPLPDNAWVEVSHAVIPTEVSGAWFWRQRGTGVWVNIGKTIVFPTPSDPAKIHSEAIEFLTKNCSKFIPPFWPELESVIFGACAREKGYDSIQFEPQQGEEPMGTFGVTGLTEFVLSTVDGDKTCGVENASETPYRSGWLASQPCICENQPIPPSCGLMPKPPPGCIDYPSLCALRKHNKSGLCDITSCLPTKCIIAP